MRLTWVITRQSPATDGSVTFATSEGEVGVDKLQVWRAIAAAFGKGVLQREVAVIHVIAARLQSLDFLLLQLQNAARNLH